MSLPTAYGNVVPFDRSDMRTAGLEVKQWAADVMRYGFDNMSYAKYLTSRTEFGVGKGGTITVPVWPWDRTVSGTTALAVGTRVPIGTQSAESFDVNIGEYGRGYVVDSFMSMLSNVNQIEKAKQGLAFNFAVTWDAFVRNTVFEAASHGARAIAAGSLSIGANPGTVAANAVIDGTMVREMYRHMRAQKVPRFSDGYYRWLSNGASLDPLMNDPGWESLQVETTNGDGMRRNVLGKFRGFIFEETEENTVDGEHHLFGPDFGVQAFGNPVRLVLEEDYLDDFGRVDAVAWMTDAGAAMALGNTGSHLFKLVSTT